MRLFVGRYHTDNPALGLRCLEKSPCSRGRWNGAIGLVEQPAVLGARVSRVAALPRRCHRVWIFLLRRHRPWLGARSGHPGMIFFDERRGGVDKSLYLKENLSKEALFPSSLRMRGAITGGVNWSGSGKSWWII